MKKKPPEKKQSSPKNIYKDARLSMLIFCSIVILILLFYCFASLFTSIGYETFRKARDVDEKITAVINNNYEPLTIIIDPGHGGEDPGAVYPLATTDTATAQIKEKDLNLEISLMLYDLLRESGVRVELTRYEDLALELADRVEMANSLAPSLFIGIHHNAAPDLSEKGTLTMFNPARDYASYGITGERAARLLQEEMVGKLETADGGLREMGNSKVLSETEMPSVIAEIAYMTNESDRQKLMTEEFRKTAAQALHDGILKVLLAMEEKA